VTLGAPAFGVSGRLSSQRDSRWRAAITSRHSRDSLLLPWKGRGWRSAASARRKTSERGDVENCPIIRG